MRISNNMMANNIQAYLFDHTETLLKLQERISTGKRINRPSDDPVGTGQMLNYRKTISSLEQYNQNITDAKLHIQNVETILGTITDILMEAKEISSDINPAERDILADELVALREQVLQLANSRDKGNYIFAGDLIDTPPFDAAGTYNGDNGSKDYLIGDGLQMNIEADGGQIFQGVQDVFAVMDTLETALRTDNAPAIIGQLSPLGEAIENLNTVRAVNAGQYKRLEATHSHYEHFQINVKGLLSSVEDADMAEAIVNLKVQQTAYESTLAASAQIVRPSLIDFLK